MATRGSEVPMARQSLALFPERTGMIPYTGGRSASRARDATPAESLGSTPTRVS